MQNNQLLLEKYEQVQVNKILRDSFQQDLTAFEQYLIREGLWDTIKQKGANLVGGAKNALLQPLVKTVLDKIAQSDPEGFKQLQAAAQDPQKLQALLNSPEVQQQQQAISQDVAATAESVDEELYELYLNEAYGNLVPEAWIDPKTGRFVKAGTPGAVERKGVSQRDARGRFVKGGTPPAAQQTLGQKIAGTADKAAIAGLKGIGKAGSAVSGLVGKGAQAIGQSKVGQAAGGFIGKATNWIKQHPKISLAAGLALLAATGGAAAVGAGGIAPLITSTLSAGAVGAAKGGVAGAAFGGIKNLAQQAQDAKSLKDINWKQAGKEALKKGAVGAAVGGAVGAGANVLGKAAAGVGKVINRYQAGTSGGGASTTQAAQQGGQAPETGRRVSNFTISNADLNKSMPDATKIVDILQDPTKGVKYGIKDFVEISSDNPTFFDPTQNSSAGYNAAVNMGYGYKIGNHHLNDILDNTLPRGLSTNQYMLQLRDLAAKNPEMASKMLAAKIAKGLQMMGTGK